MIAPQDFAAALRDAGIQFITGVPDSLLKDICAHLTATLPDEAHRIATNEGSAVGLAIGHFLATGNPALVYMQNSGLGNIVNPVTSLADPLVYGIPMLLMVGWRGEMLPDGKQLHDEPQHVKQGQITLTQLETLGIPYRVLDAHTAGIHGCIAELRNQAIQRGGPVAMVIRKQTFAPCSLPPQDASPNQPSREEAIQTVVDMLPPETAIVATTGMASRELFEYRRTLNAGHQRDFLTVGGMGHASQIAVGIAQARPDRRVVCLDGDGAILMHLGGLALAARQANLLHLVINNGAHDSVGGQPTLARELDLAAIARALGYSRVESVASRSDLSDALRRALDSSGSLFMEIRCRTGARANLGRPDVSPQDNKRNFMDFLTGTVNE